MLSFEDGFRIHVSQSARKRWCTPALGLALLSVLLLIIYWPGFSGRWFLDDFGNIHENPNVHAESLSWDSLSPALYGRAASHQRLERPVAYLTLAANYAIGGTDPFGYHVVNFLIHVLTAVAVYFLARKTLSLPALAARYGPSAHAVALLGALLWAVHPIQVSAVTYIVQRMAAMAALFSLTAMICYANGRTAQGRFSVKVFWFGLCAVSGALAVGSKQNAVMLPVSLFLYERFFWTARKKCRGVGPWLWLALAAAAIAAVSAYYSGLDVLTAGYAHRPFTLSERLWSQPRIVLYYLWLLIYPVSDRFTLLHDVVVSTGPWTPWTTLPAAAVLAALTAIAVVCRRKAPLFSFAWLFFLANHAVESSLLPLELVFEHRNYLPTVFLFIAAGAGFLTAVAYFTESRSVQLLVVGCAMVIVFSAGHTTHMQNSLFTNEIALWKDNVNKSPKLNRPRHNLGAAYFSANQWDLGIATTMAALEGKVLARTNQKWMSHFNLAKYFFYAGMEKEAALHYQQALTLLPLHPASLNGLARIMLNKGDIPSASEYNDIALRLVPKDSDFHATRGLILLRQQKPREAFREGMVAWQLKRDNPLAFFLMGESCRVMARHDLGAYFFNQSLSLSPSANASLLALIEIADVNDDRTALIRLVRRLIEQNPQKSIGRAMAAYRQKYNFMGDQRAESISRAIEKALFWQKDVN